MNKIINKFLFTGNKFMPQLHLKQPGFTYSACGSFIKHHERIQNDAHDAAYFDSNNLAKRTIPEKILRDRTYEIAKNRGYDGYERALTSMVYKLFGKKAGSRIRVNEQLAEELHKPVIKRFKRKKVYARFKDNI